MVAYIYLMKVNIGNRILYKVGRCIQEPYTHIQRLKSYPKGSQICFVMNVPEKCVESIERYLIFRMSEVFELAKGKEYFHGKYHEILILLTEEMHLFYGSPDNQCDDIYITCNASLPRTRDVQPLSEEDKQEIQTVLQNQQLIDLDVVCKWLRCSKPALILTLKRSYIDGVDYILKKAPNPNRAKYGNNYKLVLITPSCFKELAMRTASKNGDTMRRYFIEVEDAFLKYRNHTIKGLETDVAELLNNQAPRIPKSRPGYVYIVQAKEGTTLYKVGKATHLQSRMDTYITGRSDDIKILYQVQTDFMTDVEKCVATLCQSKKYRKRKEVYNNDLDMLKEIMKTCAELRSKVTRVIDKRKMEGGSVYVVFGNSEQ